MESARDPLQSKLWGRGLPTSTDTAMESHASHSGLLSPGTQTRHVLLCCWSESRKGNPSEVRVIMGPHEFVCIGVQQSQRRFTCITRRKGYRKLLDAKCNLQKEHQPVVQTVVRHQGPRPACEWMICSGCWLFLEGLESDGCLDDVPQPCAGPDAVSSTPAAATCRARILPS